MPSPDSSLLPILQFLLGTVMILQAYNKSRNLTGVEAAICRFLPVDLAHLLARYLCYVRPVQASFATVLAPLDKKEEIAYFCRTYLFVKRGKRMTDSDIRDAFTQTLGAKGLALSFSGNR